MELRTSIKESLSEVAVGIPFCCASLLKLWTVSEEFPVVHSATINKHSTQMAYGTSLFATRAIIAAPPMLLDDLVHRLFFQWQC